MKLLEREFFLDSINKLFNDTSTGAGKTLFIQGEAGIGKTSLINAAVRETEEQALVFTGTCDSLFTPRPLGPLYDVALQLSPDFQSLLKSVADRSILFTSFFDELKKKKVPVILIFEDIHWADEATLDLIKFLARRIDQLNCLFILSYRDDEITQDHPIRTIHGEIPSHLFTKLKINRLSLNAVVALSENTGFNPEEVYKLTDGNPFYVAEVLASYSPGIPENIKDSILSVFYKQTDEVRNLWELISILPGKVSIKIIELIVPDFQSILDKCIYSGILRIERNNLLFKHELYRKTIEEALTPYRRVQLNKKVLDVLLENQDEDTDLAVIVHHAKNAKKNKLVVQYAPMAAKKAAKHGAHFQAAKLFMTAIEYADFNGKELAKLFEDHAYECYLTNQTKHALESQQKALIIWEQLGERIKIGSSLRILSRLSWFEGKKEDAEKFGMEAIKELENGFPLHERAKAYSNYAQLKMLSSEKGKALKYGYKAVELAKKINDDEILCHALNNIGSVLYQQDGKSSGYIYESLKIALKNGFHEHVARAYTNISSISIEHKRYDEGIKYLNDGLSYCHQLDLDSWTYYMLSWKARYHFERCEWHEAESIARNIVDSPNHPPVVRIGSLTILGRLLIRNGDFSGLTFLDEAQQLALTTRELQRVVPVAIAYLEYGWIARDADIYKNIVELALELLCETFMVHYNSELVYWMHKNGLSFDHTLEVDEICKLSISGEWKHEAEKWQSMGCLYESALSLFEGTVDSRNEAIGLLDQLGAFGTLKFLKSELRAKGVRKIPRGPRKSTMCNPALLTQRQIDVLHLLKNGLQNAEIAEKLFIAPKTVDHHITAILSKLNVHSRIKAVAEAEKLGIL